MKPTYVDTIVPWMAEAAVAPSPEHNALGQESGAAKGGGRAGVTLGSEQDIM